MKRGPREGRERAPHSRRRGRSSRKAGTAAAPAGCVGIVEGEARPLHGGDVVDGDAVEILQAEAVHEDPEPVHSDHVIVLEGTLLDVEAVLEARAASREHAHPETRSEEHTSELQSHSFISYA